MAMGVDLETYSGEEARACSTVRASMDLKRLEAHLAWGSPRSDAVFLAMGSSPSQHP